MGGRVRKDKSGIRMYDPRKGINPCQLQRNHPAVDGLTPQRRASVDRFSRDYCTFLNRVRIPTEVVDEVEGITKRKVYKGQYKEQGLEFLTNEERTAFALIKPGEKSILEGIRIIYAHTDASCLKAKPNPTLLEWDPDLADCHLGVRISAFSYGGPMRHEWVGHSVEARGWTVFFDKNGKLRRKNLLFNAHVNEVAQHVDTRIEEGVSFAEAHRQERFHIDTGYRKVPDFLRAIGLKSESDFARTALYFVPKNTRPMEFGNVGKNNTGYGFISGYGHDNRVGVFASVRALLDTEKLPQTSIVFGFDNEEIGSSGSGGAKSKFFEKVFYGLLLRQGGEEITSRKDITEALCSEIYEKSLAIDADVTVGASGNEDSVQQRIDGVLKNIAKLDYGVFIDTCSGIFGGDQPSPFLINKLMSCLGSRNIIIQSVGSPLPADDSERLKSMNAFFEDRGFPVINVGVPVGSMHSIDEVVAKGDLYTSYQAYKALLEDRSFL